MGVLPGRAAPGRAAHLVLVLVAAGLFAAVGPGSAVAQDTRAEVIARAKAEKAKDLRPYEPGAAERIVTRIGSGFLTPPSGLFPAFGSVYSGGGVAVGPGVRVYTGDRSFLEGRALISMRQYKRVDVASIWPSLAAGRVALRVDAGWLDATRIGFYGLGMRTPQAARANFRMKETHGGGEVLVRPAGPIRLGAALALERYDIGAGRGAAPPIDQRFSPATAPGLDAGPTFVHLTASGGLDTRPAAGYARRGTLLQADFHDYRDRDETFSFSRVDAIAVQHLPIMRDTWVLSLRGLVQTTLDDEDLVPFFLLPSLGSGSTLRAYDTGRFRDRHALLLQAEWRWMVNRSGMDMAIFYDAGKVADRRRGLDLDGLTSNVGIGARFHGPSMTPLRIELARGREGFNLVFSGSAAF